MHSPAPGSLDELAALIRAFAAERDWDQFHTPKNLAMGVAIEAVGPAPAGKTGAGPP